LDGTFLLSSRRRHTRCYGSWSSDVCSSDLGCRSPHWPPSSLFAVSATNGDIDNRVSNAHGIYFHDTRFLERWTLRLDGQPLSALLSTAEGNRVVCELTNPDIQLRSGDVLYQHRIGVRRELSLGVDAVATLEVSNFHLHPLV